jgi:excisionase family DNA binding protein
MLSVTETAMELGVSAQTVRRLIRQGHIPAVKLGEAHSSSVRVPRAALESWLASHATAGGEAA